MKKTSTIQNDFRFRLPITKRENKINLRMIDSGDLNNRSEEISTKNI